MSPSAYNIACCLVTSAFSLHDLLATMLHVEHIVAEDVDAYLYEGLRELAHHGWIKWEYHPDYGNAPAAKPDSYDAAHFDDDWRRCTSIDRLREGVPDAANPTMLLEGTDFLEADLSGNGNGRG